MGFQNCIAIIFYASAFTLYMFTLKSLSGVGKSIRDTSGIPDEFRAFGRFHMYYFTIWTYALQMFFVMTAFLDETSKLLNLSLKLQKNLSRTRAFVFNTFVFPCSLLTVTIFWGVWHINRELIFPSSIEPFFPSWINHMMHTFILMPIMVEVALPKKYNFVPFRRAAVILIVYLMVYISLYFSVYFRHGVWLYPIYGVMNWPLRILFSLFKGSLCVAYQSIGIAAQNLKRIERTRKTD